MIFSFISEVQKTSIDSFFFLGHTEVKVELRKEESETYREVRKLKIKLPPINQAFLRKHKNNETSSQWEQ